MMHFEMPPVPDISLLSVMGVRVGVGLGPSSTISLSQAAFRSQTAGVKTTSR